MLADQPGPVVAVSDFMRAVPDQIARWVPGDYTSLGTDGFGFADTRGAARRFFHVDAQSIVVAVLQQLARRREVKAEAPREAFETLPARPTSTPPAPAPSAATPRTVRSRPVARDLRAEWHLR